MAKTEKPKPQYQFIDPNPPGAVERELAKLLAEMLLRRMEEERRQGACAG